jgi:predicted DCC family thiol-disulfide oxidoreductase YuxK
MTDPAPREPTALIYDQDCGLCDATAAWLAHRTDPRRLRLVAIVDAPADPSLATDLDGRELTATLHLVRPDHTVLTGAGAVLAAARLVPRWRLIARVLDHPIGHAALEPLYRQIARHRRAIGRALRLEASCSVPSSPRQSDERDATR